MNNDIQVSVDTCVRRWNRRRERRGRSGLKTSEGRRSINNSNVFRKTPEKWLSEEFQLVKDAVLPGGGRREANQLYVMYCPATRLSKVGITNHWPRRLKELQNSAGVLVGPLLVIELNEGLDWSATNLESFLHNYFKPKRQIGEWFSLDIRDIIQVKNLLWQDIFGDHIWDFVSRNAKIVSGETPDADFAWSY